MNKHKIVEAVNVGQGDCFLLRPRDCCYDKSVIVIDTGNGRYDFSKLLTEDENIHVLLTHFHKDHTNGVLHLMDDEILKKIRTLILPACYNESILIIYALLHLKGIEKMNNKWNVKEQLENVIKNQYLTKRLFKNIPVRYVKDGDELCNHIQILNPEGNSKISLRSEKLAQLMEKRNEIFDSGFANQLYTYFWLMDEERSNRSDIPEILNLFIDGEPEEVMVNESGLVASFLCENERVIQDFNNSPTELKLIKLLEAEKKKTHQNCIVLKCKYNDQTFLFGGDAEKAVWHRFKHDKKDISAKYFKVPHHGSKNNIDEEILDLINPDTAIISHNNAKFGRSSDPHPSVKVVQMLCRKNVKLICTNTIKKNENDSGYWECCSNEKSVDNVEVVEC